MACNARSVLSLDASTEKDVHGQSVLGHCQAIMNSSIYLLALSAWPYFVIFAPLFLWSIVAICCVMQNPQRQVSKKLFQDVHFSKQLCWSCGTYITNITIILPELGKQCCLPRIFSVMLYQGAFESSSAAADMSLLPMLMLKHTTLKHQREATMRQFFDRDTRASSN